MSEKKHLPWRPYFMTIVEAVHATDYIGMFYLARLIEVTEILENHDAITEALEKARRHLGDEDDDIAHAIASVAAQKKEAAAKAVAKKADIHLT